METKGVTCKIPLDLHNRISEEIRETESTMSKFIEMVIREHYEKGVNKTMEKGRTLAFQVSEELFQRVKEYLDRYEKTYHRRLTQKEFVIGLIEQALEEAEEEFEAARAAEHEEQAENGWEPAESPENDEDEEVPDNEEPEGWDVENSEAEAPAEEDDSSEGCPSENDEDTMPESWNQDEDEETELYYNRFRYYDSQQGQYTQQDPIGLAGGNPTLYGYVYDTLCELDPFGLGRMPSWMTTRKGWQRHHLIPVSVWDKYFIPQEAGMNVNGATNMTYLPVAQGIDLVNPNSSLHVGWNNVHSEYNQYISQELGKISRLAKENNWGKRKIQKEIRMLQSEVKKNLKKGKSSWFLNC